MCIVYVSGASELAGGTTGVTVEDGSCLVGSNAGKMNLLFIAYLAPELV